MDPIGYHVIMKLKGGRVIAPTVKEQRIVANVILELGKKYGLLCFRAPDTHLHNEVVCSRSEAGKFAQTAEMALKKRLHLPVGFEEARFEEINDQFHLFNAFDYDLRQDKRHGCHIDPYHEASVLQDLLGMRTLGEYVINNVRRYLPRIGNDDLLRYLQPAGFNNPVTTFAPLADSAAAALGLVSLNDNSTKVRQARVAAISVATIIASHTDLSLKSKDLAQELGINVRTLQRLRSEEVSPRLVRAVQLQFRMRQPDPTGKPLVPGLGLAVGQDQRLA